MSQITRRRFLEDSIIAAAVAASSGTTVPLVQAQEKRAASPNDTIRHAVIGCGIRGEYHTTEFCKLPGVELAYVCDPDLDRAEEKAGIAEKAQGRRPKVVQDMRRIFDDRSVDTVSITTPNHWHALASIWAMQAGKDVYCEKPVSHTVAEGRRIVEVSRNTNRICQAGTVSRSKADYAAAAEYTRSGKLGDVTLGRSIVFSRRDSIGPRGRCEIPPRCDFDLWLGPATNEKPDRPKFHYDWHWVWDTGNGELANNNIHKVDVCRWMMGLEGLGESVISVGGRLGYEDAGETPNTQFVVHTFGPKTVIQEVRGLKSDPFMTKSPKVHVLYGTQGIIAEGSLFDLDGKLVRTFGDAGDRVAGANHYTNFLDAVRTRRRESLVSEILEGHTSSSLCHIGNISYRLGRTATPGEIRAELERNKLPPSAVETLDRTLAHLRANGVDVERTPLRMGPLLRLKPHAESFVSSPEANALLSREYRKPFVVPTA